MAARDPSAALRQNTGMQPLRGSFWALVLYDVAEQIQLDKLRGLIRAEPPRREPSFKHPAHEYVRFERPPVVEYPDPVSTETGELQIRVKYFDYGVISIELELRFTADWDELVALSSRWISAPEIETRTSELIRKHAERARPALVQPYKAWLNEDYYIIHLNQALDDQGKPMSEAERNEVLQSSMSYYPGDLLVVGWVAALVYDTPEGAAPAIELLEYANTQLLEFRHYDDVLTRVLGDVYRMLETRGGILRGWKMAGQAGHLNAMRLDVTELTERTDNAIKFLSDMFYARAYRVAASKVGVTDYRNLVDEKLRIAGDLYEFMVNEFHQSRAFVLEAMVVAILVIELIHLFGGGR